MYKSLGSQFFGNTTRIQSGPDIFDKSRFVTTFFTILGPAEILYSYGLVLEGTASKEIPESSRLEFFDLRIFQQTIALSES